MLYLHSPIKDSFSYLNNTAYIAVMLEASGHTAEGN